AATRRTPSWRSTPSTTLSPASPTPTTRAMPPSSSTSPATTLPRRRGGCDALDDVVTRSPTTDYARDAALKLDLARDHLAGKEMEVGRFYLERKQYLAAINRFRRVIELYQTTTHVPEALERLTECYL